MNFLLTTLIYLIVSHVHAQEWVTVSHVIDGDTFVTQAGDKVRLLDINTPEISKAHKPAEPYSQKAKKTLRDKILHKEVRLEYGKQKRDRYKRLLAHVYDKNENWVNAQLIKEGLAHVYTFPDNRLHAEKLLAMEKTARQNKINLWQLPRWSILSAHEKFKDETIGQFHLVQGQVRNAAQVKGIIYLNFGENWRTDFTIEIPKKYVPLFKEKSINPLSHYQGKQILARGILKPVNGTLLTASHPEQISIIQP